MACAKSSHALLCPGTRVLGGRTLNNLKQSMVQFQKPKKIYSDCRVFYGAAAVLSPNDSFGPAASSGADRRGSWSRGSYMPAGPPNGTHKPGLHSAAFQVPRVPMQPFHGAPPSQPYAIPTRGAVHGPVGAVPQPGNRGFGAGRGSTTPIGSHLPHQQGTQQGVGTLGPNFNFPSFENPNSQPSVAGPLSQAGCVSNPISVQGPSQSFRDGLSMGGMSQDFLGDDFKSQGSHVPYNIADFSTQASQSGYSVDFASQGLQSGFPASFLNQNSQGGYSRFGSGNDFMTQDYMGQGSQGLFTQVGFSDPSQEDGSQGHFSAANANPLHSQGLLNPLDSQPLKHYNPPMNVQSTSQQQQAPQPPQQGQSSQNQGGHYRLRLWERERVTLIIMRYI